MAATSTPASSLPKPIPAGLKNLPWRALGPVFVLLACFAPLWSAYFGNLWSREAYQFFPLALAGVVLLLIREAEEFPRPRVAGSGWVAGSLLLISIVLLAGATWLWSPWVGAVSIIPALAGLVWWLGGWPLFRRLIPVGLLFLTIILPPLKLDEVFTLKLQHLSTIGSSYVLHLLKVTHQMYGNVIEIPGHKLLVEEACSGMKSVLFMSAAAIFFMIWRRRSLPVVVLSVLLTLGVVLLGNLIRITSGAWLEYHYQINILTGARHETVGVIMLGSYLAFVLVLDWIYGKLGVAAAAKPAPAERAARETAEVAWPVWLRIILVAFVALFAAQLVRAVNHQNVFQQKRDRAAVLDEENLNNLPDEIGSWYRLRSGPPSLLKVEAFGGITSQVWQYRKGRLVATVSLDYPFIDYHDVRKCYEMNGWQIVNNSLHPHLGIAGESPYLEVTMNKDQFREATLWFSTVDEAGRFRDSSYVYRNIIDRFQNELAHDAENYRIQMIINGTEPLNGADLQVARDFYEQIREQILAYLLPKLKS